MPYPRKSSQYVAISPQISSFFYAMTDKGPVDVLLQRFQRQRAVGKILRTDASADAVQVMFPQAQNPLWLKRYEIVYQ